MSTADVSLWNERGMKRVISGLIHFGSSADPDKDQISEVVNRFLNNSWVKYLYYLPFIEALLKCDAKSSVYWKMKNCDI